MVKLQPTSANALLISTFLILFTAQVTNQFQLHFDQQQNPENEEQSTVSVQNYQDCSNMTEEQNQITVLKDLCHSCLLDTVYDLSKTDWVEIDIPVIIESSLMRIFSKLREQFPKRQFYMGFQDFNMCFATNQIGKSMTIDDILKVSKHSFPIRDDSIFQKVQKPFLDYVIFKYEKNLQDDMLLNQNIILKYQSTQVLQLMKDQVQMILQQVTLDTQADSYFYEGQLSFIQSGIDLPFQIKDNQKQSYESRHFILGMDKNHTLNEFIYTMQKMGVSITKPVIKGIDDYISTQVNHIMIQVQNATNKIQLLTINFDMPNFANMPEIYLRKVTGNMQIVFADNGDISQTQTYLNINGLFTFDEQNYYANIIRKAFENNQINVLEETKIFPENSHIVPIKKTMLEFSKFISISPHSQVFPSEDNYEFLYQRIGLNKSHGIITDPHIKLIYKPLRVLKITGTMTTFQKEDSYFEAIQTSLDGDLAVTSTITYTGGYALEALWNIFNFQNLCRRDKLEINAFKILSLSILSNNIELSNYAKLLGQRQDFLDKGIQIRINMELKKFCQADVFCMILTKYYGSMFEFQFRGDINKIEKVFVLKTELQDIKFNERYFLDECYLNLRINYNDIENPDIDLFISGIFIGEIQQNSTLRFKSKIFLTDEGVLRLQGEMNDIFVNAFNLNNMVNMTQMTILSQIDQSGQLSDLQINGVGVFGANCYRISSIPEVFNNSNKVPLFSTKSQQQLLALLNQTFINKDNCETANINMIVNPNDFRENYFKGKLNLINLKQFYQIFFSGIAEKLTSITPDNIRDQPIINHQVDLFYDPKKVYINGVELTGAFNFNGLIDFHGLTSNIRIVMDPDYQKYLYFTIVLPSFSISQENIKFLSPVEYIEVLDDSTKAILNAFGAPKIEMQIPIENINNQFIKFSMRGVVSIMEMQQLITAEIDNQKMTFSLVGNPFHGIFRAYFKFTSIISTGQMRDNFASVFAQFEDDSNLRNIENYLNQGIKQWYNTGLSYLQAWKDRISNLEDKISEIKQTSYCDPNTCPKYSQCSQNLIIQCQKYQEQYECVRYVDICTDLQQKCTKVENICAREFKGQCLEEIEVCGEWSNICMGFNQRICKRFRNKFVSSDDSMEDEENMDVNANKVCSVYDLTCVQQSRVDQDCFMHCTQMQENYDQYRNLLKSYNTIMNFSEQLLGNLTQIKSDFQDSDENERSFFNIRNMTMDGLMDSFLVPQSTNISMEVSYDSPIDDKNRLIRTSIDFQSTSETAKMIIPFVLEDICNIYGIPEKLATRLNQIIEDIEGSVRVLQRDQNMTQDEIKNKFDKIIHSDGFEARNQNQTTKLTKQALSTQDRVSLVEKRLSQLMLEQQVSKPRKFDSGLRVEKIDDSKQSQILNDYQINSLSEFLLDR
ncbi:UNKNOWN [Stylonychia lemnae]|uniref:Uncharacterized protein n=1 Tax=Stylonychia lemnae TaxID=5949 RepID=A0A077ZY30_STYLE|nr:UNKNOWN [Stylonychia lemnae]|eukprot:CDW74137.1 UNKNOWN [Stylonychia lemnae]